MKAHEQGRSGMFLIGIAVGIGLGMLLAPRSGEEIRRTLRENTEKGREALSQRGQQLGQSARNLMEKGKDFIQRQRDNVTGAINAGRQAYRHEKESRHDIG